MRFFLQLTALALVTACAARNETRLASVELNDLGANDVSVLWPIAATNLELVPKFTVGDKGMILASQLARLPMPIDTFDKKASFEDLASELRVVGIRFDPCFRDVPNLGPCRTQMRLVVQAINGSGAARDFAVHLFYAISADELTATLKGLVTARESSAQPQQLALAVNPALLSQGSDGAYAHELKNALASFADASRLTRVAFTALRDRGNQWQFGSFDVASSGMEPVAIPGVAGNLVTFSMGVTPRNGRLAPCCGLISPAVTVPDNASGVVRMAKVGGEPLPNLAVELPKLDRIENPAVSGPGSVDCVSCHVAMVARASVLGEQPNFTYDAKARFTSAWTATPTGASGDLTSLRAFGYKNDRAIISQRTANETAAIVAQLHAGDER